MPDGPTTAEVTNPEQNLQTRIQNEAEQIVIGPNYRNEKGQLLVRPDGPTSMLPEQEWKIARTKAFKEWFGDWENPDKKSETSQIVDSNGEPLLAYHESPTEFDHFDDKFIGKTNDEGYYGRGFYFHSRKNAGVITGFYAGSDAKIAACFLNIRKPFLFTDQVPEWKGYYRWLLNRDKASALVKAKEVLDTGGWQTTLKEIEEKEDQEYYKGDIVPNKEDEIRRIEQVISKHSTFIDNLEEEYDNLNINHDGVIVANEGEKLDQTTAEIVAFKGTQTLITRWSNN